MSEAQTMEKIIENIIRSHNLYGRSFTCGVALRIAMGDGFLYNDLDAIVEETLEGIYSEVLDEMRRAGLRTDLSALAEVLDLAVLDEIARHIIEEDEE